jgi:hypothetical protein
MENTYHEFEYEVHDSHFNLYDRYANEPTDSHFNLYERYASGSTSCRIGCSRFLNFLSQVPNNEGNLEKNLFKAMELAIKSKLKEYNLKEGFRFKARDLHSQKILEGIYPGILFTKTD